MARKVVRKTVGLFSISVGLLFGILPLVPGVLLIVLGLELLGYRERIWLYWTSKYKKPTTLPAPTDTEVA